MTGDGTFTGCGHRHRRRDDGSGNRHRALSAGLPTTVVDVDPGSLQRARAAIERRIARVFGEETDSVLTRLTLATDLETAVATSSAVIEAVPEILPLKMDIFRRLAAAAPHETLLATNTSTISISRLAEAAGGSERVIGMHFFNPAHKMRLVEIVTAATLQRGDPA